MRDTRIYEKYLNMKPTEHKKIDFKVHFDSKLQMVGMILFIIGMFSLIIGLFLFGLNALNESEKPDVDKPVVVENGKDFTDIDIDTDIIGVNVINVKENKNKYEVNYELFINQDQEELAYKIIFKMTDDEEVVCEYLTSVHSGDIRNMYYKSNKDLTKAKSVKIEITTKEDLVNNYGYSL